MGGDHQQIGLYLLGGFADDPANIACFVQGLQLYPIAAGPLACLLQQAVYGALALAAGG